MSGTQPAFADTLPEDIRGDPALKDIKDLGSLAKGYVAAQKLVGAPPEQILRLPANDDAKAWDPIWNRLGRPEAPDKYAFKLPDGVKADDALLGSFRTVAHQAGLTAKQAQALTDWNIAQVGARTQAEQAAAQAARDAATTKLKTEWGTAFDQNLGDARTALQHYGDAELIQFLDANKLGDHPAVVKAFAKLGKQLREDGVIGAAGGGGGNNGALSPAEALQQLNALHATDEWKKAWRDKAYPGRADIMAKRTRLYEMAYPQGA